MGDLDYFGVRPACGCVTAWISRDYSTTEEINNFHADMYITGRRVRRAPLDGPDGWRNRLGACEHHTEVSA